MRFKSCTFHKKLACFVFAFAGFAVAVATALLFLFPTVQALSFQTTSEDNIYGIYYQREDFIDNTFYADSVFGSLSYKDSAWFEPVAGTIVRFGTSPDSYEYITYDEIESGSGVYGLKFRQSGSLDYTYICSSSGDTVFWYGDGIEYRTWTIVSIPTGTISNAFLDTLAQRFSYRSRFLYVPQRFSFIQSQEDIVFVPSFVDNKTYDRYDIPCQFVWNRSPNPEQSRFYYVSYAWDSDFEVLTISFLNYTKSFALPVWDSENYTAPDIDLMDFVIESTSNCTLLGFYTIYLNTTGFADPEGSYQEGYTSGYDAGYLAAVGDYDGTEPFYNLMFSVVQAPIDVLFGLFDINIFGINMTGVLVSIFSLCIIVAVVRIFI